MWTLLAHTIEIASTKPEGRSPRGVNGLSRLGRTRLFSQPSEIWKSSPDGAASMHFTRNVEIWKPAISIGAQHVLRPSTPFDATQSRPLQENNADDQGETQRGAAVRALGQGTFVSKFRDFWAFSGRELAGQREQVERSKSSQPTHPQHMSCFKHSEVS